jgi:glutathione S-transferase
VSKGSFPFRRRFPDQTCSIRFAFPKETAAIGKNYPLVFDTFYPGIKEEKGIKEYLASDRRLPYTRGVFRHYPELDRQ